MLPLSTALKSVQYSPFAIYNQTKHFGMKRGKKAWTSPIFANDRLEEKISSEDFYDISHFASGNKQSTMHMSLGEKIINAFTDGKKLK